MRLRIPESTDVFIIGGGPAGRAAAITARREGFHGVVADSCEPPIDKACGEGFLPDGLSALHQLGIHIPTAEARPFAGIRFLSGDLSADAKFPEDTRGLAVRRTSLHRAMIARAEQLGAEMLWNTVVQGITTTGVRVADRSVKARWIVGADGSYSRVRRWANLDSGRLRSRYAFRRHYRVAPWTDHMEVYWGDRCQGYATAVSDDQVCVAVASHDPNLRLEQALRELPQLAQRLHGADILSTERGALTGNRTLSRVWRGNVALIGDASGMVDAITGEGLGLAFSQAVTLARCFKSCNLASYQAEHRRLMLRPRFMARLLLTLDRRPRLQRRTLRVFRRNPETFRRLVALHVGALPPTKLVWDGLTLGWGILTA